MLVIDGAQGEGGGQVLRTSLALSILTGQPFTLQRIRAGRARPGLARQHLACVQAAATICGGRVQGAELRSTHLVFEPGPVRPGRYGFTVGTAGSANLVLQTILAPLALAGGDSVVTIEGGTHNDNGPTTDFLARSFVPAWQRLGGVLDVACVRHGFYPKGGGQVRATIGRSTLRPAHFLTRGTVHAVTPEVLLAKLPEDIGLRELLVCRARLGLGPEVGSVRHVDSIGPGNVCAVYVTHDDGTSVFTAFGAKGRPAEEVATDAAVQTALFLAVDAPVDAHLADQLVLPMALAGGGSLRTGEPTLHTRTNLDVVRAFVDIAVDLRDDGDGGWTLTMG